MTTAENWNPRFVAYARGRGRTPDEQLARDRVNYSGGCMTGFILWIGEQRRAFKVAHPQAFDKNDRIVDYEAWDRWIAAEGRA